jgi:hypothetical protein
VDVGSDAGRDEINSSVTTRCDRCDVVDVMWLM